MYNKSGHFYASGRPSGYSKPGHKPYNQPAVPTKDLAPAVRVKNFRNLQSIAGADNLGTLLGVSHQRLEELHAGQNFSDEIAYHIEITLGLPSGYFDQVNPVLSDAQVQRLRHLQDHEPDAEHEVPPAVRTEVPAEVPAVPPALAVTASVTQAPVVAAPAAHPRDALASVVHSAAAEREAPAVAPISTEIPASKEESSLSPAPSSNESSSPAMISLELTPAITPQTPPASVEKSIHENGPAKARRVRGLASEEELQLRAVRTRNLAMLTSGAGAKAQLGKLTNLTSANISHRLHGNKIFDNETAELFTRVLGLPLDWFDTPKTPADVSDQALSLLQVSRDMLRENAADEPTIRGKVKTVNSAPLIPATKKNAPRPVTVAVTTKAVQPAQVEAAAPLLLVAEAQRIPPAAASNTAGVASALPTRQEVRPPMFVAATTEAPAPAVSAVESSAMAVLEHNELPPVVEALIKTVLKKAHQGKLGEQKALEVLAQLIALD